GLSAGAAKRGRILQGQADRIGDLFKGMTALGVPEATQVKVGDGAMSVAATVPDIFGDGTRVQFTDDANMPEQGKGQAGWWDKANKVCWVNPELRDPLTTIWHELFHPLFEGEVANRPDIKAKIDAAIANSGTNLDDIKR